MTARERRKAELDARYEALEARKAVFERGLPSLSNREAAKVANAIADESQALADAYEAWLHEQN